MLETSKIHFSKNFKEIHSLGEISCQEVSLLMHPGLTIQIPLIVTHTYYRGSSSILEVPFRTSHPTHSVVSTTRASSDSSVVVTTAEFVVAVFAVATAAVVVS